jgi:hypothetical protein
MSQKSTLLALLASSALVLGAAGIASAADSPVGGAATEPAKTSVTVKTPTKTASTGKAATAPVVPAVPFKGAVASFRAGADNKSVDVSNKAGDWFKVSFANSCKALDGAKTVKLSQSKNNGYVWVGKAHCKVASFEKTAAVEGSSIAPLAPAPTTPAAPVTH